MILRSLRTRFLLLMLGGVVVPLSLAGLWLARSATRSGETLLRYRLDLALDHVTTQVGIRWVVLRSGLLDVGDDSAVQVLLKQAARDSTFPMGTQMVETPGPWQSVTLRSASGSTWLLADAAPSDRRAIGSSDAIAVSVPVFGRADGLPLGTVESYVPLESLVPPGAGGTAGAGVLLQITDRSTGSALGTVPFDARLMHRDEFELGGERWAVQHRMLEEPALTIAAAAPLGAYERPLKRAAATGSMAIIAVALGTLGIAAVLGRRLTRSLEELASATRSVAAGNLDRRVSEASTDEVGQVGRAFNAMTQSLRSTLRQLSQREAVAAVGQFAASLAHEVRNPLTSIRIDLQSVEERLPQGSPVRPQLGRALREIQRLDHTVTSALRLARSGTIRGGLVDLRVPLQRALDVAAVSFERSGGAVIQVELGPSPIPVQGDEAALEQVFLNLLLNAAQALGPGGKAGVNASSDATGAVVQIWDSGAGIPAEQLEQVFDPFFSTKAEGTGLGLSVARQIVDAHGGRIAITSSPDAGTTVSVRLPVPLRSDTVGTR